MARCVYLENNKPELMTYHDKAEIVKVRDDLKLMKLAVTSPVTQRLIEKNIKRLNELLTK